MAGSNRALTYPHEESIARVVWAAHILSYLTNKRNHEELYDVGNNAQRDSDTDELSDCDTDYETEKTVVLSGPRDSVRRKFLDCTAQLLSPCKGWDGVTATAIREAEDGVEVDIAGNDGFHSGADGMDCQLVGYCKMLEDYLAGSAKGADANEASLAEFELKVIDYTSRRIDTWIEGLRKTLTTQKSSSDSNFQRGLRHEAATETWTTLTNLTLHPDADSRALKHRSLIVQQAYKCLQFTQCRESLLNFIARPLIDCRLLRSIAAREPQFRNCKVSLVPSRSTTSLRLGPTPEHIVSMLAPFNQRFEKACAESFSLHAEMQLVLHYDEGCASQPTLDYLGCSKKTCLLCETFLNALPGPIVTRGRHGVCYPAWAVPGSSSKTVKVAVERLEKSLVARIRGLLDDFKHPTQKGHTANIMQSGLVSDFSHLTLEEWHQREQEVRLFDNEREMQRANLLITEGIIPTIKSRYCPIDNFEPQDCCVMCNKSPGLRCARCRSTYYCSRDCQKSDFPSHRLLCKQFATLPHRPSFEHKRAILFPVGRDKPCLIWIPCKRQADEDGISWTKIDPYPYLGTDKPFKGIMRIEHNPIRCRNLGSGFVAFAPDKKGYCVSVIHREAYLEGGSSMNRSVLASVKASCASITPHQYRGPMIALRGIHHEDYADITLANFRHLMDYLVSYRNHHVRESVPGLQYHAPTAVRGVKICCHGEVKLHGSEPFVSVDVTPANQISLGSGSISPISVCLGMPLRLWKDPDIEFRHDPPGWNGGMTADSNLNVAFLMMETDTTKSQWGWAPAYWNSGIGNVWAVREDGRKLQRMFEDVIYSDSSVVNRQKVLDYITREHMIDHWHEINEH
ncbi:hypothetical protein BJY04DRAFT_210300 [Aspergillus karnatakaensis]|uniref:uncharacterized protein n=1 Tax=Aspergillus karnatakaensis TaxID=1810916 RepID=UPI003CCE3A63